MRTLQSKDDRDVDFGSTNPKIHILSLAASGLSPACGRSRVSSLSRETREIMNNAQPIFDPETHYRIEVRGRVDVEWLQSFDSSTVINIDETRQLEDTTVLNVSTDQSGIVGLVRRLHGLGMTIQQFQIITRKLK
jgi:hypothetical protein